MAQPRLFERGIHNARGDIWAHLFPLEKRLYSYWVRHMRQYLKSREGVAEIAGFSKDAERTESGRGVRVPQSAPFICCTRVPDAMLDAFPWVERGTTDRDVGGWGETVVDWMLGTGVWRPSAWRVSEFRELKMQYEFGDFELQFVNPIVEVKTELYAGTGMLFVQTAERGHKFDVKYG